MSDAAFIFWLVVSLLFYFLPAWIGANKRNSTSIFVLNLLLGWSIIGWIVALVWATTKEEPPAATPAASTAPLPTDPDARAARLKDLRDRGVITQEEFLGLIG